MKNVNKPSTSIKNWSKDDQPSEKIMTHGAESLSNAELLAILIRNGNKEKSAVELAMEILQKSKNNLNELGKINPYELKKIKGIGNIKSVIILAALELGRRRTNTSFLIKPVITSSSDAAEYLKQFMCDLSYEIFAVLLLNRANKIIHFEVISKGGITGTIADPRIIFKLALEKMATSIILSHNHPSGNLKPSKADEDITKKIKQAASFLDITILDHIIISEEGYFSFMDEGIL